MPAVIAENLDFAAFAVSSLVLFIALHAFLWRGRLRLAAVAWMALLSLLAGGYWLVAKASQLEMERLTQSLETTAPVYAAELQRMGHAAMDEKVQAGDPRLTTIHDAINRWMMINPQIRAVETWRTSGAEAGSAPQRVLPGGAGQAGSGVDVVPELYARVITEKRLVVLPPASRGGVLGALMPLENEEKHTEAVLALTFNAGFWDGGMQRARWMAISCLGLLVLAVAAGCSTTALRRADERSTHADSARQRFEAMINGIEPVVWERDPVTHRFRFVSGQAEHLLGIPPAGWLADSFWQNALHADDRERTRAEVDQAAAAGRAWRVEYRLTAADGRIVWVRESGAPDKSPAGGSILRGVLIDVTERRTAAAQLQDVNQQLLQSSRVAGMAEVATGVLHNVGNVLNSVTVSANLLQDRTRESRMPSLTRLAGLLTEHTIDLPRFLTEDERGKQIPWYLSMLASRLEQEQTDLKAEIAHLLKNVEHIREIVAMQQSYAKAGGRTETLSAQELLEDSLRVHADSFTRHGIRVEKDFTDVPDITVDRHKVIQILVNLLVNARQAMDEVPAEQRVIRLGIDMLGHDGVRISVADAGKGIAPENLTRIFQHGFTTRAEGHGFGLHSSAIAAREMGGGLTVHSDGPGLGAVFMLDLPFRTADAHPAPAPATLTPEPALQSA